MNPEDIQNEFKMFEFWYLCCAELESYAFSDNSEQHPEFRKTIKVINDICEPKKDNAPKKIVFDYLNFDLRQAQNCRVKEDHEDIRKACERRETESFKEEKVMYI